MMEFNEVARGSEGQRELQLLQDVQGSDNNWNNPKPVALRAGAVLSCGEAQSGQDGVLFFRIKGSTAKVRLPSAVFETRYPGDLGVFDEKVLAVINSY
jgi:hypothetical protein